MWSHNGLSPAEFRRSQDMWRIGLNIYRDENGRGFKAATLRVAHALQHFERATGQGQGTCSPWRSKVAEFAGIGGKASSRKTEVSKHLAILEEAGFIWAHQAGTKGDEYSPNGMPTTWAFEIPEEIQGQLDLMFMSRQERQEHESKNRGAVGDGTYTPEGDGTYWGEKVTVPTTPIGNGTYRGEGNGTYTPEGNGTFPITSEYSSGYSSEESSEEDPWSTSVAQIGRSAQTVPDLNDLIGGTSSRGESAETNSREPF